MRRDGLWHPRLMAVVTAMGHTDELVVADAGLPVPGGVECIDLLWSRGQPPMLPVLRAVLAELVVEAAWLSTQTKEPKLVADLGDALAGLPVHRLDHQHLKERLAGARVIVRTGESTPYANVILTAGVPF